MSTQILRQQVIHIADELKISHGDDYSNEVCKAYFELLDSYPADKINTLQIIIEAFCDTIDYDNKNKVISSLQKKLQELESTIKIQNTKINNIEETIKKQDINIKTQESKINNLEERLTKQEQRQLFNKYVIGIQDINALEQLETKLADASELVKLHKDRIDGCHYINDKYSNNEKAIRINLLIDKLTNIPENIKELFEDEYPHLLDELKAVLVKRDYILEDARFIKKSNNLWEY
jgi:uncharacterized coiled-coil protein SlyX